MDHFLKTLSNPDNQLGFLGVMTCWIIPTIVIFGILSYRVVDFYHTRKMPVKEIFANDDNQILLLFSTLGIVVSIIALITIFAYVPSF